MEERIMLNIDINQFWKDDEIAHQNNCFNPKATQAALGIRMSDECVFAELGEGGAPWGYTEPKRRQELNKRYNQKAIEIVGIPLLSEELQNPDAKFPNCKRIGEVFEAKYFMNNDTEWLEGSIQTPQELEKMLDRVDKNDLREFILPANWESEKKRLFETYGIKPSVCRSVRGPVTLATSIYGIENLIYLYYDEPELFERFSKTIADVIIKSTKLFDEESGLKENYFAFADDNCYLLNEEMYESFGAPVLQSVFDNFATGENAFRYQHSDSPMEHLLPILGRFDLTVCNFGPTVTVDKIRKYMKNTRIDGCIAPFTFMNNDEKSIIEEVKRDCEMAKEYKGLNVFTAGSINNGSLLTSMRAVMFAIQNYGRY